MRMRIPEARTFLGAAHLSFISIPKGIGREEALKERGHGIFPLLKREDRA